MERTTPTRVKDIQAVLYVFGFISSHSVSIVEKALVLLHTLSS